MKEILSTTETLGLYRIVLSGNRTKTLAITQIAHRSLRARPPRGDASVFIKSAISGVHSPPRRCGPQTKHYENVIRQNFPEDCLIRARPRPSRGGGAPAVPTARGPRSLARCAPTY